MFLVSDKSNLKTQRLAVCSILVALSVLLSVIKIFALPFGGEVTLFGMVPIMVASFLYGTKYGLLCGFVDGIFQCILGISSSGALAGLNLVSAVLMILLDYFIGFSVIGTAGVFRNFFKKPTVALSVGAVFSCFLRFITHTISGIVLYGSYAEQFFTQEGFYSWGETVIAKYSGIALSAIYSLIYNASYMIPETALSVIACTVLLSVKPLAKNILKESR